MCGETRISGTALKCPRCWLKREKGMGKSLMDGMGGVAIAGAKNGGKFLLEAHKMEAMNQDQLAALR